MISRWGFGAGAQGPRGTGAASGPSGLTHSEGQDGSQWVKP